MKVRKIKSGNFNAVSAKLTKTNFLKASNFWGIIIFVYAFMLYANTISHEYNLDDVLVTQNHRLTSKGISALSEIFKSPYYQDDMGYSYEYRPMVLASFAIEHAFFGDSPHLGHFFNVLLFAILCLLIFKALLQIYGKRYLWFIVGVCLLFVSHTIHTEAVCSIKNRDEILAFLFGIISLRFSFVFIDGKKWALILIPMFYVASLMSKVTAMSMILIVPIFIVLYRTPSFLSYLKMIISMIIPNHFFITNIGSFEKHIYISIAILLTLILFFVINNFKHVSSQIYCFFKVVVLSIRDNLRLSLNSFKFETIESFSFLQFSEGYKLPCFKYLMFPFAFFLLYLALFFSNNFAAAIPFLFLLGFGIVFLKEEYRIWMIIFFSTSLFITNFFILNHAAWGYNNSLMMFLLFYLFSNVRYRWIIATIAFLYWAVGMTSLWEQNITPLLFLFFLSTKNRKWNIFIQIPVFLFYSIKLFPLSANKNIWVEINDIIIPFFFVLLNFDRVRKIATPFLIVVISFLISYDLYFGSRTKGKIHQESESNIQLGVSQSSRYSNLIPTGNDRILGFIEQSIQPTDIWQVKIGTSASILLKYFQKVIIPYPLAFYYGYSEIEPVSITETKPLIGVIVYLMLFLLAVYGWFRDKILASGILIYLFSIIFFANYFAPVPGMFAERFLLIPSLGFCIMLVWALGKIFRIDFSKNIDIKKVAPAPKYTFIAILLAYAVLTFSRNMDWKDQVTLFRHDIKNVPNSVQANNLLATALMAKSVSTQDINESSSLRQEAKHYFKRAIQICPDFFNVKYDLGRVYNIEGNADSSKYYFEQAAKLPNTFPQLYFDLIEIYKAPNDTSGLINCFQRLSEIDTINQSYLQNLYLLSMAKQNYQKALTSGLKAVKIAPDAPAPLVAVADAYLKLGITDSAIYYYGKAYKVNGDPVLKREIEKLQSKID